MGLKITFYDGVNCIGGNKILLEDGDYSIFLDFGTNFNEENKYFDEFLRPRQILGIYDYINLNLLPPLYGVYREDLSQIISWEKFNDHPQFREIYPSALLISHAHLDHIGYLSHIKENVPIFTSLISAVIIKCLEDTSRNISDLCFVKKKTVKDGILKRNKEEICQRPYFAFGNCNNEEIIHFWQKIERKTQVECERKNINIINNSYNLGTTKIKFFPVDHSIPGAGSFLIETSAGNVVYTGDLRLHGRNSYYTKKFIDELKEIPIKVLLCEGTHPSVEKPHTEEDVKENVLKIVRKSKNYIFADFGPRNIDRLLTFLEVGKETGRKLVLTMKDIYLLENLSYLGFPDPKKDDFITFYAKPKGSYDSWEENLLSRYENISGKAISSQDIKRHPEDYILCISYYDFHILLDILPEGGTYIFSSSEAFNEEMKIDQQKIENWLKYFHIEIRGNLVEKREESPFHASGHIHKDGLYELITKSHPEILIPIHTEKREFFREFNNFCKVIYPEKGETIFIE